MGSIVHSSVMFSNSFLIGFCSLFFCILLKLSHSNSTSSNETYRNLSFAENYSREIVSNNSREEMQPMPLITHLNKSAAEVLIQEANQMYVSNTSFDDIISDNETHQLFIQYRERKRQARLMTIQHEILQKLGFEQEPNISSRISEEQRMSLVSSFSRVSEVGENYTTV